MGSWNGITDSSGVGFGRGQEVINQRIYMHNPWAQTIVGGRPMEGWRLGGRGREGRENGQHL